MYFLVVSWNSVKLRSVTARLDFFLLPTETVVDALQQKVYQYFARTTQQENVPTANSEAFPPLFLFYYVRSIVDERLRTDALYYIMSTP